MALTSKLIRRISNHSTSNVIHSSGYAQAQSGSAMGASDDTSFAERQQIEQNRHLVQGYRDAHVAQSVNHMQKAMSVEEKAALDAAEAAMSESTHGLSNVEKERREFNSRLESGGIMKYDSRNRDSRFGQSGQSSSYGGIARQSGAAGRQEAAAARAAMADRFSGHAHPVPKSGGFGRH